MVAPLLDSPVVSTQWLADHLGAEGLVVVDASVLLFTQPNGRVGYVSGHETYLLGGHVPGAVFADLIDEFSDPDGRFAFTRPTVSRFERAAGALGIDNETTIVVYDSVAGQWAARVWWLFRAFGYDRVAVLDGGLTAWTNEERPIELGHVEGALREFSAVERPELWASKSDIEAIVAGAAPGALVCAIPAKEFTGEAGHRARRGHIPGSISVPVGSLLDRATNTLAEEERLAHLLAPALDSERVITYCNGGIAAAADALALTLLGHTNVAIYDESLNEWAADLDAPLVTTAAA